MNASDGDAGRVPSSTKLGYGVGAVGAQIFRDTPALILPIYLMTVLGVPAWMAGVAILIPKAWIIFCDPLVGSWSDHRRDSWGRAPFLLVGALLSAVGFLTMFSAPDLASPWLRAGYITLTFLAASTAYSLFSVPYLGVAAEMSPLGPERTRIMAYRMAFLAVGVAIGAGYALPVARYFGGGWTGFQRMGLLYGSVCALTMLVTWFTVHGLPRPATPLDRPPAAGGRLRALIGNRPFVLLSSAYFIVLTGQAITYTVYGLFFIFVAKSPDGLIPVNVAAALSVVVAQPATLWMTRHWSKRTIYMIGAIGWSLMSISWVWADSGEAARLSQWTGLPLTPTLVFALRGFFWGGFNAVYALMALSLLTDTIAWDRDRHGATRSGLFAGVFSALEKVAFAMGPAIAGLILSFGGFVEDRGGGTAQTPEAMRTLVLTFAVIPAIFTLASLVPMSRYRLSD
ncbi:MAG: MFS transporter [Steroidobacteraceae bacterium]